MLVASLKYENRAYYLELRDGARFTFGSGEKDTFRILDMAPGQIAVYAVGGRVGIRAAAPFRYQSDDVPTGVFTCIDSRTDTKIYVSRSTGIANESFHLPYDGIVRAGRAGQNDIAINLPFVSAAHFQLRIQDGMVRVEDLDSTNGTYLNGLRIKAAIFHPGDVLNILTVRIKFVNSQLQFENVGTSLTLAAPQQKPPPPNREKQPSGNRTPVHRAAGNRNYRLSPRIQDQLPQEAIILDRPPKKGQDYHPTGSRLASLLSMGAMAGTSLLMGVASPALACARAVGLIANAYNIAASSKLDKQRKAEAEEYNRLREEEYRTYIEAQRARILMVAMEQRRILSEENPEPKECLKIAEKMDRRLWERMRTDRDFLDVRVGMGYEELCVPIKNYAENRGLMMEDDELEALCNSIAEENRIVDYIPLRIPLRETPAIGIVGSRDRVVHLVRNMLISLTALHTRQDLRLIGIFDEEERRRWAAVRWLPHIWDDSGQMRCIAFDRKRAQSVCAMLYDILKRRLDDEKADGGKKTVPCPHYVVVFGSFAMVEHEPVLELLAANNGSLGATAIFLFDDFYFFPRACSYFIDMSGDAPSAFKKLEANHRSVFTPDAAVPVPDFDKFARQLASIRLEDHSQNTALPASITFLDGFRVKSVEQLDILSRWRKNRVIGSLAAPVGVLSSGEPFCLDIHYKAHGAHGLLAGTTGSGKSELLRTWILSMAVNFHPHEVNFVIIDYKGGGMANKLDALPHVVGKITNIDTNISRSLVSLKREAKRRMEIFKNHPGVDDIDQYMQLYYAGNASGPMPHLIIVSDEFAELKKEEPEFLKELSSLARVGRSVGIHLVLATQRPAGVVDDQIDSNARFRICMKVNSIQDSKELLKRPDAASITQRGRAFVRIGEDEMFELFQSYWSGADYSKEGTGTQPFPNQVSIVDVTGERIQFSAAQREEGQVGADQLTAVVGHLCEQADLAKIKKLPGPWKPELPALLPVKLLEQMGMPVGFNGTDWKNMPADFLVPVGLYDRPDLQQQGIQYLNFSACTHYGIYGGPGSGKTTLLKTLILSLGMQFSPREVHIWILDFGGQSLRAYGEMPHVAMTILESQGERLHSFMDWTLQEISRRKACFAEERVANFKEYRKRKRDIPAVFVVIDNLLKLSILYNEIDPFLIDLTMAGSDCGMHLIFTSNNINKTGMNLRTNIDGNIALRMTDHNDYRTAIVEFPEGSRAPTTPGRALIRDTGAAEFQTAIFTAENGAVSESEALEELIGQMKAGWHGPSASFQANVKTTPDSVTVDAMLPHYTRRDVLPLGMDGQSPVMVDLSRKHTLLLSSSDPEVSLSALAGLVRLLSSREDNQIWFLDGGGSFGSLGSGLASYAAGADQLNAAAAALLQELERREDALYEHEEDGDFSPQYPQICVILDAPHRIAQDLTDANLEGLCRLCRNTEDLGAVIIAHGYCNDLLQYMYTEELTITFIDSPVDENWQKGVCLGGIVRDHDYFLQKMLAPEERSARLAPQDGLLFDCGSAVRFKRMLS